MVTTPFPWKPLTQVNTAAERHDFGQIVGLQDGGYVVVWEDQSGTFNPAGRAIVGQRYDSVGNKVGGEVKISQFNDGSQTSAAVTLLPNGNIAVAFMDRFDTDRDIWVRIYNSSLSPVRTDAIDTADTVETISPSITAFADGGYVVSYNSDLSDIMARRVSPTGVVGAQFAIDPAADQPSIASNLATLTNGNFVAVYHDLSPGGPVNNDIRFRIMTSTGAQVAGPSGFIGGTDSANEQDPDVAALFGRFVVVWTDGLSDSDIRATILNNSATSVLASNLLVNTTTAGAQNEASVVTLADGGFLVSWDDSSANLVRAQRFDADGHKVGAEFIVKSGDASFSGPEDGLLRDGRVAFALTHEPSGERDTDMTTSIWDARNNPPLADFNRDTKGDILWRHDNGTTNVFLMDGAAVIGGSNTSLQIDNTWTIQDKNDFNGDGRADILWRHSNGTSNVFLMDGATVIGGSNTGLQVDNNWTVRGTDDFNGDGRADILWRHSNGTANVFLMDGSTVLGGSNLSIQLPTSWTVQDTGDFNRDGRADILWRHTDGMTRIQMMDGASVLSSTNTSLQVDNGWIVQGVDDFNGDGSADILWRHTNGTSNVFLMDGSVVLAGSNTSLQVDNNWSVQDTGDYNGDTRADILWRHTNGTTNVFLMDGATVLGGSNTSLQVDNGWSSCSGSAAPARATALLLRWL